MGAEMANVAYILASKDIRPEMSHGVRCRPTMFTKQVSRRAGQSGCPIMAAEGNKSSELGEKAWSRARSEVFCALHHGTYALARRRSGVSVPLHAAT